jgi:hypothetical protein
MRQNVVTSLVTTPAPTQADNGKSAAPNIGKANCAECSRQGEDNSMHIAIAIIAVGLLAVAAGYLNIRVSAGK